MAASGADRVREHRLRKRASEFAAEYLDGRDVVSMDEFLAAKKQEFEVENNCVLCDFDAGLTNMFADDAKDNCEENDDGAYLVKELLESWEYADAEYTRP